MSGSVNFYFSDSSESSLTMLTLFLPIRGRLNWCAGWMPEELSCIDRFGVVSSII